MSTPKKKLYICTVDNYYAEGSSLTEAYENLREITEDATSPNDCYFYEATLIHVKMELIPTLTEE